MKRTLIGLAIALGGCGQNHESGTSSSEAELVRLVERGDGRACNHPEALERITLSATGALSFSEEDNWNGGWTTALVQDFRNTFTGAASNVVINEHDVEASLVSCSALYTATTDGSWFNTPIDYDIQLTVDGEPIIELNDERELQSVVWRAQHLYYCQRIYPEQVQRYGTPYQIICTDRELQGVERSRLEPPGSQIVAPTPPIPHNAPLSSSPTASPSLSPASSRSSTGDESGSRIVGSSPPPQPTTSPAQTRETGPAPPASPQAGDESPAIPALRPLPKSRQFRPPTTGQPMTAQSTPAE